MTQLIVNRYGYMKEIPDDWRIPHSSRAASDIEREYYERTGDALADNAKAKKSKKAAQDK